jgi:uncharacterized protein (DUF983 family)
MKCPKCRRGYAIRTRIKTMDRVCGNCGFIGKIEEFEEKTGKEKGK